MTTGKPNSIYVKKGDEAVYRAAVGEDGLDVGRHGPGGADRLTKEYVPPQKVEVLGADGKWHPAPVALDDPEVERGVRFFKAFLEHSGPNIQAGEVLRGIVDNMPVEGGTPYHFTQTAIINHLHGQFRVMEKDAIRLSHMQVERNVLDRSLNHPFFAMYPSSYYFDKVIPETLRFLGYKPFGFQSTLGLETAFKVQQTIAARVDLRPWARQDVGRRRQERRHGPVRTCPPACRGRRCRLACRPGSVRCRTASGTSARPCPPRLTPSARSAGSIASRTRRVRSVTSLAVWFPT